MNEVFLTILNKLQETISHVAYTTWFSDCEYVTENSKEFVICTCGEFKKSMIEDNFSSRIEEILFELTGKHLKLVVLPDSCMAIDYITRKRGRHAGLLPIREQYVFDRFQVGKSNRLAYKAACAVAKNPGAPERNPLYIYGTPGIGKTHLLFAIGQKIREENPSMKIVYIKGDDFMNYLVRSIREKKTEEFRNEFRRADVLLIDDIQIIAGKPATQEEFFNTYNELYQAGKQMVFTSNSLPCQLATLEDRLRSRFEGGLIVGIESPEKALRKEILSAKAKELEVELTEEEINYMAEKLTLNVRQMEGALKNIRGYSQIMGEKPGNVIDKAMESLIQPENINQFKPKVITA